MKSKQTTTTTTKAVFYCYIDHAVTQYRHKGPIDVASFPGSPLAPTKIYIIQKGFIFRRGEGRAREWGYDSIFSLQLQLLNYLQQP